MATPRKHWFRVGDAILREEFDREQRSTLVGLLAWFNQRRQRDGHRGARAQEASIPPGDLLTITLSESLEEARKCCERLRERCDLHIEERGTFTFIRWPKLAKFQEWNRPSDARRLPAARPPIARELPSPAPAPTPAPTEEKSAPRKPKRQRQIKLLENPPAPPSDEDPKWSDMADWLAYHYPDRVLPLERVEKLRAMRPNGTLYGIGAVQSWYVATAPKISAHGYSDLWKATRNWWQRIRPYEIDAAYDYCKQLAAEKFAVDHPPREPEPVDPEAYRLVYSAITARSVGGVK